MVYNGWWWWMMVNHGLIWWIPTWYSNEFNSLRTWNGHWISLNLILKIVIFQSYVSLPECTVLFIIQLQHIWETSLGIERNFPNQLQIYLYPAKNIRHEQPYCTVHIFFGLLNIVQLRVQLCSWYMSIFLLQSGLQMCVQYRIGDVTNWVCPEIIAQWASKFRQTTVLKNMAKQRTADPGIL